jgi:hypothetical protein
MNKCRFVMTRNQKLLYELQLASTESEAFDVWTRYHDLLDDSAFILSLPGKSPLPAKLTKQFGQKARLIPLFAENDLFFLNHHIHQELTMDRDCTFPITYVMLFDTNATSHLRALFGGRDTGPTQDLWELLRQFRGNRLNWQVTPYLMENAGAIAEGRNSQDIFETVLATEKVEAIDAEHFIATGQIRLQINEAELINKAVTELSQFVRLLNNGLLGVINGRFETFYVSLLFIALQQIRLPGREFASKKLKSVVKFMDQEMHVLLTDILGIACEWFTGGKRVAILNRLQRNAPNLIRNAKNISWDVFHLLQLRQEATFVRKDNRFLIPYLLTFDQALADLMEMCAIKSCLTGGTFHYPVCFPKINPETVFGPVIGRDIKFMDQYLSPEANARRLNWQDQNDRSHLSPLRQKLESELSEYEAGG